MFQNFIPASSWRPLNRNTDLWNVPWLFAESKLTTLSKITPQTVNFWSKILRPMCIKKPHHSFTFTNALKCPPTSENKHGLKSTCWLFCDRVYEILKMINALRIVSVCSPGYFSFLPSDDLCFPSTIPSLLYKEI